MNSTETTATTGEYTVQALTQKAQFLLKGLDYFLIEQVQAFEPEVRELIEYTFGNPGKRLRPLLVFFSGWTEGLENDPELSKKLVQAAAIVEMVHLATLVHDDILDDAAVRHGCLTLSAKYGSHVAILAGDTLFAHALKLASDFPTVDVCREISLATRKVCVGEIHQTLYQPQNTFCFEKYWKVIEYKTAALFEASCFLGAYLSGGTSEFVQAARAFGHHLGIAYQIFDDITDFWGNAANAGKTLGTDLETGKITLPLLLLHKSVSAADRSKLHDLVKSQNVDVMVLMGLFARYNILEQTTAAFEETIAKALASISPFQADAAYVQLESLAITIEQMLEKILQARAN